MKVAWTTEDELRFIAGLGTHCASSGSGAVAHLDAEQLRELYAMAVSKRVKWGSIDRIKIENSLMQFA